MKDKIYDVIQKSNKGLTDLEVVKSIMKDYTPEDIKQVDDELRELCRSGVIRTNNRNEYIINRLTIGKVDLHEKGNAHIIVEGSEDLFVPRDLVNGAQDGDIVLVEHLSEKEMKKRKSSRLLYKVVRIAERNLGGGIGEVVNENGELKVVPTAKDLPFDIVVEDNDLNLVDGNLVKLKYVTDLPAKRVLVRVDEILGHKNALLNPGQEPTEVSGEIAKIACEFGIPLQFTAEALEEAKNMPKSLSEDLIKEELAVGRVDFRNDLVYTIDGKDTKDIDDAIGVKILPNGNIQLAVHIADVSYYVKPGSALWKEAERRGNSNYLGNKVIPMLPVELSNGICSLNPNEDRFTTSCIMEIDHSGHVVNKKVCKGIIRSKKKMNYDAVQALIDKEFDSPELEGYDTLEYTLRDGETLDTVASENGITKEELLKYNPDFDENKTKVLNVPCYKLIENAYRLSKELSAMKKRRGEIQFESDETKIKQNEKDDVPYDVIPRDQRPAERLIEDFMVAANESVAEFLEEYEMAAYRIHDVPLEKSMREYLDLLEKLGIHYNGNIDPANVTSADCQRLLEFLKDEKLFRVLNKKLLRTMPKAIYSTENRGHFGIASKKYAHFTSPIRRFADLLNHTSIGYILKRDKIEDKFIKQWQSYLTTVCEKISKCERNSEKCEFAVDDMLKAWYMMSHIGEEFEVTIDTLMQGAFFVQTDNYIDGRVAEIEREDGESISVNSYYQYSEEAYAYTRNGRVDLRYGDRVIVKCINSDPLSREIDFALVRKAS